MSYQAVKAGDYESALAEAQKIGMPGLYMQHIMLGIAYGLLERNEEAAAAIARVRELTRRPGRSASAGSAA